MCIYLQAMSCHFFLFLTLMFSTSALGTQSAKNDDKNPTEIELFSLETDDQNVRSISFSPNSKFVSVVTGSNSISVFETDTGEKKFSGLENISSAVFIADKLILGYSDVGVGLWTEWNLETGQQIETPANFVNASKRFRGLIDKRDTKTFSKVFVSDGQHLGEFDFASRKFTSIIPWRELEEMYANERLSFHEDPISVAESTFRSILPRVIEAAENQLVLAFGRQSQFVINKSEEKWECKLNRHQIVPGDSSSLDEYYADTGSSKLTLLKSYLDEPAKLKSDSPYYGIYYVSFPKGESLAQLSFHHNIIIDIPRSRLGSDKTRSNRLVRFSKLESGDELFVMSSDSHPFLASVVNVSDIQISPNGKALSFVTDRTTKFSKIYIMNLSAIPGLK